MWCEAYKIYESLKFSMTDFKHAARSALARFASSLLSLTFRNSHMLKG